MSYSSFKKLIIPVSSLSAIGSGIGGYFITRFEKINVEKELETTLLFSGKKLLDKFFSECQKEIKENKVAWNNLYDSGSSSEINFSCGAAQVIMKISETLKNNYQIIDTTKRWWPDKDEKSIFVIEILEPSDNSKWSEEI